jgi:hypothetical protein
MSRCFHPCPSCAQHLRADETTCPFCEAPLPAGFGACTPARGASGPPVSRAALLFVGATVAAACGGQTSTAPSDGGRDALTNEGGGDDTDAQPVALYGPGPIQLDSGPGEASPDAETDAPSDATDSGGSPVLYGPAPVDGG